MVIVKTKLHEAWKDASHQERSLFMQDIVFFYRPLVEELLSKREEEEKKC